MKQQILRKNQPSIKKYLKKWFESSIKTASFNIKDISLDNSKNWFIKDGIIRHRSGKFFKVLALEWSEPGGKIHKQPYIDQREIGILGFILREKNGKRELLVQAKIEPGNTGIIQLAPTCQATSSNIKKVHGGNLPPFADYFKSGNKEIIYDKKQSEQGTRFYHKLNRNVLAVSAKKIKYSRLHHWLKIEQVLECLKINYLMNTDARSVLTCSPWEILIGRKPFSLNKDKFGIELNKSYFSKVSLFKLKDLKNEIVSRRKKIKKPKTISLEKLPRWEINKFGVMPKGNTSFRIKHIKVRIKTREVPIWDQPIIESRGMGKTYLLCGRKKGILYFLFKTITEAGLYNQVELTPTIVIEPGKKRKKISIPKGIIVADCYQSEEGGRFYKDRNHYRIIDIGEIKNTPADSYWLNLGQINRLLREEGWFTNEARSVLSLILAWL